MDTEVPGGTPERARALERATEALERQPGTEAPHLGVETPMQPTEQPVAAPVTAVPRTVATPKSPLREDIEDALSEGLEAIYTELAPAEQAKFREGGERLALKLETMIASGKVILRDIHRAIVEWLKLLPRRTKSFAFFLLQEAKVKTDAILALARRPRE